MSLDERPEADVQRKMIEQRRDQFRAAGFDAEMEVVCLKAQQVPAEQEREKAKTLGEFRQKAENCYASAREMVRLLAELPEPEKPAT